LKLGGGFSRQNSCKNDFAVLLFAVVGFQLAGQSSLFLGRIAPRFFHSHLIVPLGILAVASALVTFCLSAGDSQMLPALAACLLVVAISGWVFQMVFTTEKVTGMLGVAFGLSIGLGPLAILSTHYYFGPKIDAFLLGDFLGIAVVLLGLSCLVIALVLWHLARLPLRLAISGKTLPISLADIKTSAIANSQQSTKTHWPLKIASGILDRHIARGFHGNQPTQRISLWHAAITGMGPLQKVPFTLFLGLCFGFRLVRGRNDPDVYLALALGAPLAIGIFWLFGSSLCWHFRLKSFGYELLLRFFSQSDRRPPCLVVHDTPTGLHRLLSMERRCR